MSTAFPLERMQRWFQAVVVHPGSVEEAVAAPEAERELPAVRVGELLLPSRTLSPVERVGIYHGMYLLRMHDALQSDYEALQHFLGDRGFFRLVADYVQRHPSRSHTLNRLGDHLPEFIRDHSDLKRRDFCHDLARLERSVSQAFDAEETPALTEAQITAVPQDAWERARLVPIAAFRLEALRYPANAYLQTVRDDDHDHPRPRLKAEWVAIYRKNYAVYRLALEKPAFDLLSDLASGRRLGEAVAAALKRGGKRAPGEERLFRWFREWVSGGIFRAVEID